MRDLLQCPLSSFITIPHFVFETDLCNWMQIAPGTCDCVPSRTYPRPLRSSGTRPRVGGDHVRFPGDTNDSTPNLRFGRMRCISCCCTAHVLAACPGILRAASSPKLHMLHALLSLQSTLYPTCRRISPQLEPLRDRFRTPTEASPFLLAVVKKRQCSYIAILNR